ncbi:hypothetical protein ACFIN9_40910 [Streptomyces noursei]|uniref:hypothetical protein n=1 Tax=Streptomyces noursei TaxID=1971 RepID=UPI0036D30BF2
MHDSTPPPLSSPNPPSGPAPERGGDAVEREVAREIVGTVIAWYSKQLLLARHSGDEQRLEQLKAQRLECVEDQRRLDEAGPQEITRIATAYTARWKELDAATPPES